MHQRGDVLHRRGVNEHDIHAAAQRGELLRLDGLHGVSAQIGDDVADVGHSEGSVALGGHQVVGGAPVAKTADVGAGPVVIGRTGGAAGDLRRLGLNERDQRLSAILPAKQLAQQTERAGEGFGEHAVHTGPQGDDGHAHLLLEGISLLHVLVLGDDDVRLAGEDLLRLGGLRVGPADAAGGQGGEHVAVGQHVGPGHGVKHLGPVIQCGVVDVLDAAQQRRVADVAVHP